MRLAAVHVGAPKTVPWQGRRVSTGIFKEPVPGRVMVRRSNIDGDRQADLKVHGGEYKAVYGYALEHYDWWRGRLGQAVEPGMFGENLTIEGFDEENVCVGDAFAIGGAVLEAAQPRLPCYKLGIRFGDPSIVKRFTEAARWGVYFKVLQEGELGAGDEVRRVRIDPARFPVAELAGLYFSRKRNEGRLRLALSLPSLPPNWKKMLGGGKDLIEP